MLWVVLMLLWIALDPALAEHLNEPLIFKHTKLTYICENKEHVCSFMVQSTQYVTIYFDIGPQHAQIHGPLPFCSWRPLLL